MKLRLVLMPGRVAEPIIQGEVSVPGLDLEVITEVNGHQIRSFADLDAAADDSDAHSVGSGTLIQYTALGEREPRRFLPVFHARGPKCRNILVRDDGSVQTPTDLRGARVGVPSFTNTASIWIRGWLADEYGVQPTEIMWVEGERDFVSVHTPSMHRESPDDGARTGDRNALVGMLKRGELDALCWTGGGGYYAFYRGGPLDRFCREQGGVRSLVDDPQTILDYYRRTQLDHITETVAIKDSTLKREPESAALLLELFRKAAATARAAMTPEERELQGKEMELIGRDPFDFQFGPFERNSIQRLAFYNHEQEITPRVPSLEELTPPGMA
ncbi:MAG: 4,5-dihydroxyphthalate decarboxylase [Chloroflexota bacterium]|jgi:4,5-dihydroxyphthalate decarboxylase|nr:4,5-dihydroxyphthalate decarboxylase [Chloroflexota bacterium]